MTVVGSQGNGQDGMNQKECNAVVGFHVLICV